jgi:hypothetical protein
VIEYRKYLCTAWFGGNLTSHSRRALEMYGWVFKSPGGHIDYDGEPLQGYEATLRVNVSTSAFAEEACHNNFRHVNLVDQSCRVAWLSVEPV